MYRLTNPILHYEWGSPTTIPDYLGTVADGKPHAEVWMGAHPSAPSLATNVAEESGGLAIPTAPLALSEVIAQDPRGTLGESLAEQFGAQLPFLAKLLAADKPLSLQVHPSRSRAQLQYRQEEADKTPRSLRNYMDPNHKPELLMALAPTLALVGFRPAPDAASTFADLKSPAAARIADILRGPGSTEKRVQAAFVECLALSDAETEEILADLPTPSDHLDPNKPLEIASALAVYHQDPGAVASLLLNTVLLSPGEGLYVPSGVIHAYIQGFGLEVMASSDNVLRAGLTHKRVDREELLEAASFTPQEPQVVAAEPLGEGTAVTYGYHTPESDFSLRVIERAKPTSTGLDVPPTQISNPGARILICLDGELTVTSNHGSLRLRRGESAFVGATDGVVDVSGAGRMAVVSAGCQ